MSRESSPIRDELRRPARRPVVLVAESQGFSSDAALRLCSVARTEFLDLQRDELIACIADADVLWVRLRNYIDNEVLSAAPRLKTIVSPTTGLNHIDLAAARSRGIQVMSLRGEVAFLRNIRATAEHTLALMLALLRRLPNATLNAVNDDWRRDEFKGHEIYGKRVGIIGYGRIGRIVSDYLSALGAEVVAHDPLLDESAFASTVRRVSLDELLSTSDIVSVHVNLTDDNIGLLGKRELGLMKSGSWLLNTARGEVVDEGALLEALQMGRIAGAALDVLADEHSIDVREHPLIAFARWHDNLILTPHIGGCTFESMAKTELFLANKLVATMQGDSRSHKGT